MKKYRITLISGVTMIVSEETFRAKFRTRAYFVDTLGEGVKVAPRSSTHSGDLEEHGTGVVLASIPACGQSLVDFSVNERISFQLRESLHGDSSRANERAVLMIDDTRIVISAPEKLPPRHSRIDFCHETPVLSCF